MPGEGEQAASSTRGAFGVRSASPAKRSAADMEAGEDKTAQDVPGSFGKSEVNASMDFDEAMAGMTPDTNGDADADTATQASAVEASGQSSARASTSTTTTSATSVQFDEPPAYSALPTTEDAGNMELPSIDEQERLVRQLSADELDEGQLGFVVSTRWLARVLSRSSEGQKSSTFPKEAREGKIGPIDNSDVVPDGTFPNQPIHDANKKPYIPLKPGLSLGEDYELLPEKAWGQVVGWYGMVRGQKQIVRYVHNTAPAEAAMPNYMYELYPPVLTIRKLPQPSQEQKPSPTASYEAPRKKQEQQQRGQMSPDDAIRLVASRSEKFQIFLRRAKEAADIPFSTKVKVWRIGKASNAVAKGNPSGVLSPPHSRSTSPQSEQPPKLVISATAFNELRECEEITNNDETANAKYNGSSTLDTFQLFEDSTLVLEEQIGGPAGGEFASDKKPKHTIKFGLPGRALGSKAPSAAPSRGASPAPAGVMTRGRQKRDGRTRGTVGLSNLGNTCYMNSALQCIRSVEELAIYFLSNKYKEEINGSNPLGHGGAMAKQYSTLLQGIYGENAGGSFTPSAFKKTLGQMQPLFSGYGQQDSQEFLSFLVDAIHEDLNRIIKKPYNENPDSDDATVRDPAAIVKLGETYRSNHRARNESIAMDLFNGFYKNTMECPDCGKISITFDPFSLVTVQLPIESTFTHTYIFFPLSGKPVKHDIDFDKNATVKALKEYIASKHSGVEATRLWMTEVYSHKVYKVFEDSLTLAETGISNNDFIFLFELAAAPSNAPAVSKSQQYTSHNLWSNKKKEDPVPEMDDPKGDHFAVPVFSRQKNRFGNGWEYIMHPTYIVVTREEAKNYDAVLKKVLIATSRLTSAPILTELQDAKDLEANDSDEQTEIGDSSAEDKEISDRSASEDGYVEISKHANTEPPLSKKDDAEQDDRPVPGGFMDPQYVLSAALRNHLFNMKYVKSEEGLYCTGFGSNNDRAAGQVSERVKQPPRRGSTDSSTSSDESTASTASGTPEDGEPEIQESENEFDDKPDMVIGEQTEDSLSMPSPFEQGDDNDGLPDDPPNGRKPGAKRGEKQRRGKKRGGRGKPKTYSRKDRQKQKDQSNGIGGRYNVGNKSPPKQEEDEDNPYYIKLGEGILLDWYPESLNKLFAGNPEDVDDERGLLISTQDGKKVELFHDRVIEEKRAKRAQRKKQGVSLDECFVETGKREVLSEDNAWYCGRCKELRRATKTLEIWTIPDILVVHLKRFGGNRSFRDKIDVLVDYPVEGLDMTERVGLKEDGKEYIYDLFAVDNHYGGLGGGHYTAYVKNFYDGQWYDYNDASCSKLGDRNLNNNSAAYLLFYRRRSPTPLGPQYLQDLVNEARNPVAIADAPANDDAAEESDSGEGRLGGRADGSLRSSGLRNGVGVGASSANNSALFGSGGSSVGARQEAGSSLMTRETEMSENQKVFYGPARPPHMREYGNQGSAGWGFSELEKDDDEMDGAGSDADSVAANLDHDEDGDARMGNDLPELESIHNPLSSSAGAGTPNGTTVSFDDHDDHTLYSGGRTDYSWPNDAEEVLHLEDAGGMGGDSDSPPTVELRSPGGDVGMNDGDGDSDADPLHQD